MAFNDIQEVFCPYCAQAMGVAIDYSAGEQEYVQDCGVCCRPVVLTVRQDDRGIFSVNVCRENE